MKLQDRILEAARDCPPLLYHYTSSDGLLGIVGNRNIRATSVYCLNDTQEFLLGVNLVQAAIKDRLTQTTHTDEHKFLEEVIEHLHVVYEHPSGVACFSAEGDLLSQWRAYASGQDGVCLGFQRDGLVALCPDQGFMLVRCFYDEGIQRDLIIEMISEQLALLNNELQQVPTGQKDNVITVRAQQCLLQIAFASSIFKHHSFREENEWRLVSPPLDPGYALLRFRSGPRGLVPFTEFKLESDRVTMPLETVIAGPSSKPVQVFLAIKTFISLHTAQSCTLKQSRCTYRTW